MHVLFARDSGSAGLMLVWKSRKGAGRLALTHRAFSCSSPSDYFKVFHSLGTTPAVPTLFLQQCAEAGDDFRLLLVKIGRFRKVFRQIIELALRAVGCRLDSRRLSETAGAEALDELP